MIPLCDWGGRDEKNLLHIFYGGEWYLDIICCFLSSVSLFLSVAMLELAFSLTLGIFLAMGLTR